MSLPEAHEEAYASALLRCWPRGPGSDLPSLCTSHPTRLREMCPLMLVTSCCLSFRYPLASSLAAPTYKTPSSPGAAMPPTTSRSGAAPCESEYPPSRPDPTPTSPPNLCTDDQPLPGSDMASLTETWSVCRVAWSHLTTPLTSFLTQRAPRPPNSDPPRQRNPNQGLRGLDP